MRRSTRALASHLRLHQRRDQELRNSRQAIRSAEDSSCPDVEKANAERVDGACAVFWEGDIQSERFCCEMPLMNRTTRQTKTLPVWQKREPSLARTLERKLSLWLEWCQLKIIRRWFAKLHWTVASHLSPHRSKLLERARRPWRARFDRFRIPGTSPRVLAPNPGKPVIPFFLQR
jgi:hypothetical protein